LLNQGVNISDNIVPGLVVAAGFNR